MKYCPECQRTYPESTRFCLEDGKPLAKDPHDLVGRLLFGKYKVDGYIGEGGSSAVYTAQQTSGGARRVAVKVLLPRVTRNNEELGRRFLVEASAAAQLKHPNIVEIIEAGRTPEGLACLIMEWLEGETLESRLKEKGSLGPETTLDLLRQIASAFQAAHDRQIIHLDLKPTKILLLRKDGRDQVKIVDFAILNAFGNAFTPSYASPEQCLRSGALDARSDIYSLGVLLFRMLTGRLPFEASSSADLIAMHTQDPPPRVSTYRPDIPPGIDRLIEQMMAKKPSDRPASATEVVRKYEQAITMTNVVRVADHPELAAEVGRPAPPPAPKHAEPPPPPDPFATNFMMGVDENANFATNVVRIDEPEAFATNVMGMTPELQDLAAKTPPARPAPESPAPRPQSVTMEIREFNRLREQHEAEAQATPAPVGQTRNNWWPIAVLAVLLFLIAVAIYMVWPT